LRGSLGLMRQELDVTAIRRQAKAGEPVSSEVVLRLCREIEHLSRLLEDIRRETLERV
jgi:hypothetical protein